MCSYESKYIIRLCNVVNLQPDGPQILHLCESYKAVELNVTLMIS